MAYVEFPNGSTATMTVEFGNDCSGHNEHVCESLVHDANEDVLAVGYITLDEVAVYYLCRNCIHYVIETRKVDNLYMGGV